MLSEKLAHRLITALVNSDPAELDTILLANAYLQLRGNGRMQIYWTRPQVRAALQAEFSRWHQPTVLIGDISLHTSSISVTFQIEERKNGRLANHDYFALIVPCNNQVQTIILYCYHDIAWATTGVWSLSFPAKDSALDLIAAAPTTRSFAY